MQWHYMAAVAFGKLCIAHAALMLLSSSLHVPDQLLHRKPTICIAPCMWQEIVSQENIATSPPLGLAVQVSVRCPAEALKLFLEVVMLGSQLFWLLGKGYACACGQPYVS